MMLTILFLALGLLLGLAWRAYQWKRSLPVPYIDKEAEHRRRYQEWLSKQDRSGSVITTPGMRNDDYP